jgi:uncharacterized membrane protein
MQESKKSGEFYFDDAAVIRCDAKGKVHIKETGDMGSIKGAGVGALVGGVGGLIGGVIGLLAGPVGVAVGISAGAAVGALAVNEDAGFDDESLEEIGEVLVPGSSALAVTTRQDFVEEISLQGPEGESTSAAKEIAENIRQNLEAQRNVLYSLVITEDGVAARQIVSSPKELAVFGI